MAEIPAPIEEPEHLEAREPLERHLCSEEQLRAFGKGKAAFGLIAKTLSFRTNQGAPRSPPATS